MGSSYLEWQYWQKFLSFFWKITTHGCGKFHVKSIFLSRFIKQITLGQIGLLPPHFLINFEIQKYYQKEPKFNGVYSRNNLPKTKDCAYVINYDEYKSIRTHWIALYMNANKVVHFDSFGVENIPKEI